MKTIDPTSYPRAIADLLVVRPVAPLGPGAPVNGVREQLAAIDDATFGPVVDRDLSAACRAGLWLAFNFLDESHQISQSLDTREGSYWHALMHRREPDHPNAAYWFRRVGTPPVFESLQEVAAGLAGTAPAEAAFLTRQTRWDPFAFNDLCSANHDPIASCGALCQSVQEAEWELLFAWCFKHAIGA